MKKYILYLFAMTIGLVGLSSCSEEASEEEEYANWKERNEQFLASLVNDSLKQQNWQRIKLFSLDSTTEGAASDYIYVKKITNGEGTETPIFTDSVRVVYQGRLLPSKSYPKGFVFDGTVYGEYSPVTAYTKRQAVSNTILGFATALQNMHKGDYWRVYIPSELGYGTSDYSTIPGYSVLVFDLTLIDFSPVGEAMKPWR